MYTSEHLNELVGALVGARKKFKPILKESTGQIGQNRHYSYADLSTILEATVPALLEAGLILVQGPDAESHTLVTRLCHTSGQWLETRHPMRDYERPQELGSALTYARRYALSALLCVAAEDDDDAAGAQDAKPTPQPARPTPPVPERKPDFILTRPKAETPTSSGPVISPAQGKRMYAIAKASGWSDDDIRAVIRQYGFDHTKDITRESYETICATFAAPPPPPEPPSDDDMVVF